MEKEFLDLSSPLTCDTLLAVKMVMRNGKPGFVHYAIPTQRQDGSFRLFGDLYYYFSRREGFRFAIGYLMFEDEDPSFWKANYQYFYFDKNNLPFESYRKQPNSIFLPKSRKRR